jgi:hypothetical protein
MRFLVHRALTKQVRGAQPNEEAREHKRDPMQREGRNASGLTGLRLRAAERSQCEFYA